MVTIMFLAFLACVAQCFKVSAREEQAFVGWMRDTKQFYIGEEYQLRLGIWLTATRYIQAHSSRKLRFSVGLNKFASWTPAEYASLLGSKDYTDVGSTPLAEKFLLQEVPTSIDWRTKGIVNPLIKDQGHCGACWAFGAVGAAESADAQNTGKLISFSEKNLLDCVTTCPGCNGGAAILAYMYVIAHQDGQFMLESDYPYQPVKEECLWDATKAVGSISAYTSLTNEDLLLTGVGNVGPVSVSVDSSCYSFQLYEDGVYDEPDCSTEAHDHAVLVIGYGVEDGDLYWLIKNSWGTVWGAAGYMKMLRGVNMCAIGTSGRLPTA